MTKLTALVSHFFFLVIVFTKKFHMITSIYMQVETGRKLCIHMQIEVVLLIGLPVNIFVGKKKILQEKVLFLLTNAFQG